RTTGSTTGTAEAGKAPAAPLLAELHAERAARMQPVASAVSPAAGASSAAAGPSGAGNGGKKSKKKGGKKTGGGGTAINLEGVDPDDVDALLAAMDMDRGTNTCGMKGCKKKGVELVGSVCCFCKLRYCLQHGQPEVHGCGEEAKGGARAKWLKDMEKGRPVAAGSQEHRHQALHNQLEKALADKTKTRERKQPESNKDKKK
ncbi:hypothetical protein CYMTET_11906, partial [Cymbomonas tetramitiformis]